jgi:uncharacterized membrane protein YdjX (TVP38/TMEM64 family)
MQEKLLEIFNQYPHLAILISIVISIVVALLGLVPSVFVTAANIYFFGFWKGTAVSLAGEALGAIIAFIMYRKGFRKATHNALEKYPKAQRLVDAEGREAFTLILALRLIPFVPSGLVTFAAAIGKVTAGVFFAASTIGKIPALMIEAYSVYQVSEFGWQGKAILGVAAVALIVWVIRKRKKKKTPGDPI